MTTTLAPAPTPVLEVSENGDHDRFAHYAPKDEITKALVMGTPIRAICGKVWVPAHDPSKYPLCPECDGIYKALP